MLRQSAMCQLCEGRLIVVSGTKLESYLICRQIWSLERSKEEAEVAIEEAQKVQQTLQRQRTALNEKKKVAIFEFESKHLQTLKEIEDEIRSMTA